MINFKLTFIRLACWYIFDKMWLLCIPHLGPNSVQVWVWSPSQNLRENVTLLVLHTKLLNIVVIHIVLSSNVFPVFFASKLSIIQTNFCFNVICIYIDSLLIEMLSIFVCIICCIKAVNEKLIYSVFYYLHMETCFGSRIILESA